MAGLRDIALKCNVSTALVSRVLNQDPSLSVTDEVRKRIREEAALQGYMTPRQRRLLKVRSVALVLAPIEPYGFEQPVIEQVNSLASELGMRVSLYASGKKYDGMIILGEYSKKEIEQLSLSAGYTLLINNRGIDDYSYDTVMLDYSASERMLIEYLKQRGVTSIGYFGGVTERDGNPIGQKRIDGFRHALIESALYNPDFFNISEMDEESGYRAVSETPEIPDVMIFSDSLYAKGAIRALKERQEHPITVTYVNFDRGPSGADIDMKIFGEQVWRTCLKFMKDRMSGELNERLRTYIPAHLEHYR